MKKKIILSVAIPIFFLLAVTGSFFAGKHVQDKEYLESRAERYNKLIIFAIDTVENKGLSVDGALEVVVSNIYAAHELCDNVEISAELNDLWNALIYKSESYIAREEVLAAQLKDILERGQ